ncbi:MAG TPA: PhzF family phenazine biosynthesis protein [Candidatus Binataceae bacterium]|nr:PhzF family phenazine biosynthesis protein [Candidatus Binataceae bacterium]
MRIPIYQVDNFTSRIFSGNPAAVCRLQRWLPDQTMQAIAAENNLSETAYYTREGTQYHLRWFTPTVEVDLCGHATLASAHVIWTIRKESCAARLEFQSRSGMLTVEREGALYALDFPALAPAECAVDPGLVAGLGAHPNLVLGARDYLCVFESEEEVRALTPNMERLTALDRFAVIATAPGRDCDFVSRFFAPAQGVAEDPVTGSAHCTLAPYWSRRLGKKKLFARQVSRRGGEIWCEDRGERVRIAGHAVTVLEGEIEVG